MVNNQQPLLSFDISTYRLDTQGGTKQAAKDLEAYLKAIPEAERASAFLDRQGDKIVEVLGKHGLGNEEKRFINLGIKLMQA